MLEQNILLSFWQLYTEKSGWRGVTNILPVFVTTIDQIALMVTIWLKCLQFLFLCKFEIKGWPGNVQIRAESRLFIIWFPLSIFVNWSVNNSNNYRQMSAPMMRRKIFDRILKLLHSPSTPFTSEQSILIRPVVFWEEREFSTCSSTYHSTGPSYYRDQ